jgi:nucleoside-triphosphatase THEP1
MSSDPIIITGAVDSGKTSMLYSLCSRLDLAGYSFGGMIQVPALPGKPKREYVWSDQASGETRLLMSEDEQPGMIRFGRFWFDEQTFAWARERMAAASSAVDYLTFDEIGPLELEGKGLDGMLRTMLASFGGTIIAVVRRPLLEHVCVRYGLHIDHVRILHADRPWEAQLERVLS